MVHTVGRGRVEPFIEPRPLFEKFGVNPKLIKGVESFVCDVNGRCDSEECERKIKGPAGDTAEPSLPEGNGQIVILALMMNDVHTPQKVNSMACAVPPIVGEIDISIGKNPSECGCRI